MWLVRVTGCVSYAIMQRDVLVGIAAAPSAELVLQAGAVARTVTVDQCALQQ